MIIKVAVGIIFNEHNDVLIAHRHSHKHQGNTWEFPGGKLEDNETVESALKRELFEEVGITVITHEFWFDIPYTYPDKKVHLYIHKVLKFTGEPKGLEGQPIQWVDPRVLKSLSFPQANHPIVERLLAYEL